MDRADLKRFMRRAIALSLDAVNTDQGGPFGAVVVLNGRIIGEGFNRVTSTNDPTAHAEIVAIRQACAATGHFHLEGAVLFTSCEPCPMCLAAAYWAHIAQIYYAANREDAAAIQFDDAFLYREICVDPAQRSVPITPLLREEALSAFREWAVKLDKIRY